MPSESRKTCGTYKCHPEDDINRLKVRIKIWKAASDKNEEETYTFKWQEKIFSMKEIKKYRNMQEGEASEYEMSCKETLDKWIRINHKMLKDHRLYTIVNDEMTNMKLENDQVSMTDFENEKLTMTEANFQEAQLSQSEEPIGQERPSGLPVQVKLVENPTHEDILRQFFRSPKPARMQVMFDHRGSIKQDEEQQPLDEAADDEQQQQQQQQQQLDKTQKVLCTLTFNQKNNQLTINPDFCTQPIILGNWRYTIENASNKMSEAELSREISAMNERNKLKSEGKQMFRPTDFDMPPTAAALRVLFRGEIVAGKNFEFDNLYVQFFVDLPQDWWANSPHGLSGVTQICKTRVEEVLLPIERLDSVAYFSFPFEFELNFERLVPASETDFDFPRWPVMYFEVMSQDAWTRHRTEGYSHLTLPNMAGSHEFKLNCWRPSGDSVVCELRRYFVGGTPSLEDATYAKAPSTFSGNLLSKFGLNTEATGELVVRMHSIHQSVSSISSHETARESSAKVSQGFSSAGPSQADLMRALNKFRAARTQLITVQRSSIIGQSLPAERAPLSRSDFSWPSRARGDAMQHANGTVPNRDARNEVDENEEEEEVEAAAGEGGLMDTRSRVAEQYSKQLREE